MARMGPPEIVHAAGAHLGEGPAWDAKTGRLYWVDILQKRLHFHHGHEDGFVQLQATLGCVAPCKDGMLMLAMRTPEGKNGFARLDPASNELNTLMAVTEPASNRFNDGKCDPQGRFLAGTMDMNEKEASGALYSFDGTGVTRLLDGICISNGLAWSPDLQTLYHIDTPTREVKAYDYDLASGQVQDPRVVIQIPSSMGWPDGMTSDMDGNLWIAMWAGAQVTCWNPYKGELLNRIPLSARNVTSLAFGGRDMDELFVTTARVGLDAADLAAFKDSGSLMRIQTGVTGMPTFEFG
jgi:sugar lactone lactonase YvrE